MGTLTAIVMTRDEELHVQRVLDSLAGIESIFVVDALSEDHTRALAEAAGATVVEHAWEGYAAQKNWALANLPISTEWVLFVDADEVLTPALRAEIEQAVRDPEISGWYVPRANIFLGRVLKHAWWYPDYQMRLFRLGRGRYEDRLVHEHVIIDGKEAFLVEPLLHENLKGIDAFVSRQLKYAGLEAIEMRQLREGTGGEQRRGRLLGTWPERRRALKTLVWYRIPGRPLIRFLWMYVVRRGFLDGKQGLLYSQLIAFNEALINAKTFELEQAARREAIDG